MEKKNNAVWWVVGIIVVALVIFFVVRSHNSAGTAMTDTSANPQQPADTTALVATEDVTAPSVDANTPAAILSYQQALTQYGTKRIQFDPTCTATPNNQTWTNNTNIMLDNRSAQAISLHLGSLGDTSIKAWGFKIVNLSSTMLPNVITIDCGAKQNVAQIKIQK